MSPASLFRAPVWPWHWENVPSLPLSLPLVSLRSGEPGLSPDWLSERLTRYSYSYLNTICHHYTANCHQGHQQYLLLQVEFIINHWSIWPNNCSGKSLRPFLIDFIAAEERWSLKSVDLVLELLNTKLKKQSVNQSSPGATKLLYHWSVTCLSLVHKASTMGLWISGILMIQCQDHC